MFGRSSNCALIALLFSFTLPLWCQDSAPVIRTTSRLVLLDVVVTDKAGHPIRGLTEDAFTILENGVAQKITSFQGPLNGSRRANRSRTIILLDELNIQFSDLAYARDRIALFLEKNPAEDQPTALMAVGPHGLTMVEDFTQDSKRLRERLMHLPPFDANPKGGTDAYWAQERAQQALHALTEIARASVGSPYGLNVIWVTSGFSGMLQMPGTHYDVESNLRNVANVLMRSRMRLYTIDPAGVVPMGEISPAPPKLTRGSIQDAHISAADQMLGSVHGEAMSADVLLSHMSRMMGGRSYYGRNDVEGAISDAVVDGSSSYLISYSPSDTNFNGDYRKIEVNTNTEGATARTRQGYYAVADDAAPNREITDAVLDAAMSSPLSYAGLDVACPATYDAAKGQLIGKLTVTPKPLLATADQNEQVIRFASFSKDHKTLDRWSWRVNWKTPWTNRVVSASFDRPLSPKATSARFVVSDAAAQRIGTCDYRVP
ncbi:MAG: VWA domain-containing protein [Bryobacteraceae bacterium]